MPNDGGAMFKVASSCSLRFHDNLEKHKHATESHRSEKIFDVHNPISSSSLSHSLSLSLKNIFFHP